MKQLSLLLLLSFYCIDFAYGQEMTVNGNIDVKQTNIRIDEYPFINPVMCYNTEHDGIIYFQAGTSGESGYDVELLLNKDGITLKTIFREVDFVPSGEANADGDVIMAEKTVRHELVMKHYRLEVNQPSFKIGDTLKARFDVIVRDLSLKQDKRLRGEIFHIINHGGQVFWTDGKSATNATIDKQLKENPRP